jgi:hypothetical protein
MAANRNVWKSCKLSDSSFKSKPHKWFSNYTATLSGRRTVTETVHGVAKGEQRILEACSVYPNDMYRETIERDEVMAGSSRRKL